jgi:hypothetical protein
MDDLRARCGDGVFTPGRGVDVDLILLRGYRVNPDFVDLPEGVLGRTTFDPDGGLLVEVSRELAEGADHSNVTRRRLRSTLAHECGHIVFHRHLFLADGQQSLFAPAAQASPHVLCRGDAIDDRVRRRDGREYQANRGMASLLLPAGLVRAQVKDILEAHGYDSLRGAAADGGAEQVLRNVCDVFDVSLQMTLYRVLDLGLLPKETAQSDFGW